MKIERFEDIKALGRLKKYEEQKPPNREP